MDRVALIALLERHEGIRKKAYVDTAGKITIGIGRNLTDVGLSLDEIVVLVNTDINGVLADLETFAWWAGLSDLRQQAIADLRFNVGAGGFRLFPKLIHALAVEDYPSAAQELRSSQIAPLRREELARMLEQG